MHAARPEAMPGLLEAAARAETAAAIRWDARRQTIKRIAEAAYRDDPLGGPDE